MSKFLEILKEALSDKKYGWEECKKKTFPDEAICKRIRREFDLLHKGQAAVSDMPPPPQGVYGDEDCLSKWWNRERKDYFN